MSGSCGWELWLAHLCVLGWGEGCRRWAALKKVALKDVMGELQDLR